MRKERNQFTRPVKPPLAEARFSGRNTPLPGQSRWGRIDGRF
jgi:hypothetical protein